MFVIWVVIHNLHQMKDARWIIIDNLIIPIFIIVVEELLDIRIVGVNLHDARMTSFYKKSRAFLDFDVGIIAVMIDERLLDFISIHIRRNRIKHGVNHLVVENHIKSNKTFH